MKRKYFIFFVTGYLSIIVSVACSRTEISITPTYQALEINSTEGVEITDTPIITQANFVSTFETQTTGIAILTPTQTATPIKSTPDFLDSPVASSVLFSPDDDSDCLLPCWYDLRVGKSSRADIQSVFDEVFGFHETYILFNDTPQPAPIWIPDIPNTQADGYEWERFIIILVINSNSDKLHGIRLIQDAFGAYNLPSVSDVIQLLGPPDYYQTVIIRDLEQALPENSISVSVILFYDEGMALLLSSEAWIQKQETNGDSQNIVHYCLDDTPYRSESYITEPFNSLEPNKLDPLQMDWFAKYIDQPLKWASGEQVFGLTIEEFVEIAGQDPPCFDFN